MKYLIYSISVLIVLSIFYSTRTESMMNKLTGNIEILSDSNIFRVNLSSEEKEVILTKNKDYLISSFHTSPDIKMRVIATTGSVDDPTRLVLYSGNKRFETILKKVFVGYPSFSPDGKYIAYLKKDYNSNKWIDDWYLYLVNIDGSSDRQLTNLSLSNYRPSWFPDGEKLIVTSKNMSIFIVNAKTGEASKIINHGIAPSLSNDGKSIAYLSKEVDLETTNLINDYVNMSKENYITASNDEEKSKNMNEIESFFFKNSIYIYNIESDEYKKLTEILPIEAPVLWSPKDKYLLFNDEKTLGHEIYVIDIETSAKKNLSSIKGEIMYWGD
jgi:Tol biopolymer transport system component